VPPPVYQLTDRAIAAVRRERAEGIPQQTLAFWIGATPVTLSKWLRRYPSEPIRPGDPRVKRLLAWLEVTWDEGVERRP